MNRKPEESDDHRQYDAKGNPLYRANAAHTPPQAMPLLVVGLVRVIVCHTVYPTVDVLQGKPSGQGDLSL